MTHKPKSPQVLAIVLTLLTTAAQAQQQTTLRAGRQGSLAEQHNRQPGSPQRARSTMPLAG